MSSIKVLYNPDLSNHDVKKIAIFKYTIWPVRNLVKVGKSLHQINFNNLFASNERKFHYL